MRYKDQPNYIVPVDMNKRFAHWAPIPSQWPILSRHYIKYMMKNGNICRYTKLLVCSLYRLSVWCRVVFPSLLAAVCLSIGKMLWWHAFWFLCGRKS